MIKKILILAGILFSLATSQAQSFEPFSVVLDPEKPEKSTVVILPVDTPNVHGLGRGIVLLPKKDYELTIQGGDTVMSVTIERDDYRKRKRVVLHEGKLVGGQFNVLQPFCDSCWVTSTLENSGRLVDSTGNHISSGLHAVYFQTNGQIVVCEKGGRMAKDSEYRLYNQYGQALVSWQTPHLHLGNLRPDGNYLAVRPDRSYVVVRPDGSYAPVITVTADFPEAENDE